MAKKTDKQDLLDDWRLAEPVYVTSPTLPSLDSYKKMLEGIWERKWLTNEGEYHKQLESALKEYLGVDYINLFCNGTIALLVALQALRINNGEVITTPFTFAATTHVLWWNRIKPVFCDIDPKTLNLNPARLESLISSETKAILPVHVYGFPCDVEAIEKIADAHGLPVIYDAAHAFGVKYKGRSLLEHGDISMLSFHATKLFTTTEGGALVVKTESQRRRINFLKNFGIADEMTVIAPGINGKMNELSAAFGLLQLEMVTTEINNRARVTNDYREGLKNIPGVRVFGDMPETRHNYAYFPMLIDAEAYGMTRDALYSELKKFNIFTRKYFAPLCSQMPCYASLPSANPRHLPMAESAAREVLCLPIYGTLPENTVNQICRVIRELARK